MLPMEKLPPTKYLCFYATIQLTSFPYHSPTHLRLWPFPKAYFPFLCPISVLGGYKETCLSFSAKSSRSASLVFFRAFFNLSYPVPPISCQESHSNIPTPSREQTHCGHPCCALFLPLAHFPGLCLIYHSRFIASRWHRPCLASGCFRYLHVPGNQAPCWVLGETYSSALCYPWGTRDQLLRVFMGFWAIALESIQEAA